MKRYQMRKFIVLLFPILYYLMILYHSSMQVNSLQFINTQAYLLKSIIIFLIIGCGLSLWNILLIKSLKSYVKILIGILFILVVNVVSLFAFSNLYPGMLYVTMMEGLSYIIVLIGNILSLCIYCFISMRKVQK